MVISALITIVAWFLGLLIDVNLGSDPAGILCLRVLFPVLAMGLCILRSINKGSDKSNGQN